ncbi:Zinc finger homeobox protein 3, partial [Fasciola gigantica]
CVCVCVCVCVCTIPLLHLSLLPPRYQTVSSEPHASGFSVTKTTMSAIKLCPYCLSKSTHPRLGRGESYVCGYKPYRCEVCNYSTTTKGNLAIHQQSDKHLNNIQDQEQAKVQRSIKSDCGLTGDNNDGPETLNFNTTSNKQCSLKSNVNIVSTSTYTNNNPNKKCALDKFEQTVQQFTSSKTTSIPFLTASATDHTVLGCSEPYPQQENPPLPLASFWVSNSMPVPLPQLTQSKGSGEFTLCDKGSDLYLSQLMDNTSYPFVCKVCCAFSTDQPDLLIKHAERNRFPLNSDPINPVITTHSGNVWFCRLCAYKSPLKANFQLHCKTEKHAQRLNLLLHVCEGGPAHQARVLSCPVLHRRLGLFDYGEMGTFGLHETISMPTSPIQLLCLACDVYTTSVHKFRVHCQCARHERAVEVFAQLVNRRSQLWTHISGLCLSFVQLACFPQSPRTVNNFISDRLAQMSRVLSTIKVEYVCEFPRCTAGECRVTGVEVVKNFSTISEALTHWHTSEHQQVLAQQNSLEHPLHQLNKDHDGIGLRWCLDELRGTGDQLPLLLSALGGHTNFALNLGCFDSRNVKVNQTLFPESEAVEDKGYKVDNRPDGLNCNSGTSNEDNLGFLVTYSFALTTRERKNPRALYS